MPGVSAHQLAPFLLGMLVTLLTSAGDWLRRRATSVLLRLVRFILLESLSLTLAKN
jgi:hypothetical protein